MQFLDRFSLPTEDEEVSFLLNSAKLDMTCYDRTNAYPFKLFPKKEMPVLTFDPITVFYGGNGSGKSTLLNILAEKLRLSRLTLFNETPFFADYLKLCHAEQTHGALDKESTIITSDAVFDFLIELRSVNAQIDRRRDNLFAEYSRVKDPNIHHPLQSLEDLEAFKRHRDIKKSTKSDFTRRNSELQNLRGKSNGECAYWYFTTHIKENALYLLDEPENSLSAKLQKELAGFLVDSVRFYGCQFILSTHSPFLLAMKGAKIYDLDSVPVRERDFAELDAVRIYYDFFKEHEQAFR